MEQTTGKPDYNGVGEREVQKVQLQRKVGGIVHICCIKCVKF